MRRLFASILALVILGACVGPKPEVRSAEVAPPKDGKAVVTVVVLNRGAGDGQIELKITLRDGKGSVVARDGRPLELRGRETVTVVMELQVPDDAQGLRVEVEAVYPPD